MKLFDEKAIGNKISQELSNFLRQYTGQKERTLVAEDCNLSDSTIRDLVYRSTTVKKTNMEALKMISLKAVDISRNSIKTSVNVKKMIEEELNK